MPNNSTHARRRNVLQLIGAGSVMAVTGCIGLPGISGTGDISRDTDLIEKGTQLDFATNLRDRRLATPQEWPIQKRKDVPSRDADSWQGTGSFESAPWSPPEGWEDTPAGDVDQLKVINHGAATMGFDPATLATHELFERKTGITLKVIAQGVDKANQQEQQVFRAEKSSPHLMNINGSLMPLFTRRGYLAPVDALYPTEDVWDPYIPALRNIVDWDIDQTRKGTHQYGFPNISEATIGNLRTDLIEEQGLDPEQYQGEWSWDLLEKTMKAFEGTGTYGFAYYAGTPTYLSYSFRGLLYQQGGRLVQSDGTVKFDTQAAITVVEKMAEWYQKGWVPGDVLTYGEGDLAGLFLSDNLAYVNTFSDLVPQALSKYELDAQYRAVLPPKATTGPNPAQAPLVAPNATVINTFSDTKHSLAALLYGDLRLSYTSQWWEFTYEGNISHIKQLYEDTDEYGFATFGALFGRAIENGVSELFPQMQSVFVRMTTHIQDAIRGERSPTETMRTVQDWVDTNINTKSDSDHTALSSL